MNYPALNLTPAKLKVRDGLKGKEVFDSFRKKWILLNPEEWVRQHLIHYLVDFLHYPKNLVAIEHGIQIAGNPLRLDALVFKNDKPILIIECKAPNVKLSQTVLDQASKYNHHFQVKNLLLSNGLSHFFCRQESGEWQVEQGILDYGDL